MRAGRGFFAVSYLVAIAAAALFATAALPVLAHSYRHALLEREAENLLLDLRWVQTREETAPMMRFRKRHVPSFFALQIEPHGYTIYCIKDGDEAQNIVLRHHAFPPHVVIPVVEGTNTRFRFTNAMKPVKLPFSTIVLQWDDHPLERKFIILTKDGRIRMDRVPPKEQEERWRDGR